MTGVEHDLAAYFAGRGIAAAVVTGAVTVPRCFSGARREHLATRRHAGLFDFSFMGCWEIVGVGALEFLQRLQTRNLRSLRPGRLGYTLLCRPDGTVLNDATVWCHDASRFWLFTGRRSDASHVMEQARHHAVHVDDLSGRLGVIALQGPRSARIVSRLADSWLSAVSGLRYFDFSALALDGAPAWIARLGYSGEYGFELVMPIERAVAVWERLLALGGPEGLVECGFDAADSLRIEAGHILFSRELAEPATPYELGLGRLVAPRQEPFIGSESLRSLRREAPARLLMGVVPEPAGPEDRVIAPATAVAARLTSECRSPTFDRRLGLAWVANGAPGGARKAGEFGDVGHAGAGRIAYLQDGRRVRVCRLPFFDPPRAVPRAVPRDVPRDVPRAGAT